MQNHQESFEIDNFFSRESWEAILFKCFNARAPARTRARQNHIFWKFFDFRIFSEFPTFKVKLARACARAGAHMIKFEKYEHSAFTAKKIDKSGQKAKILQKKWKCPWNPKKGVFYIRSYMHENTLRENKLDDSRK